MGLTEYKLSGPHADTFSKKKKMHDLEIQFTF